MADKMLRLAGRGEDGTAKALDANNEGNLKVLNVKINEPVTLFDSVDVSAGTHASEDIDLTRIGSEKVIYIFNTSDAPVRLRAQHRPGGVIGNITRDIKDIDDEDIEITIQPSNSVQQVLPEEFSVLRGFHNIIRFVIRYEPGNEPTVGSFKAVLIHR